MELAFLCGRDNVVLQAPDDALVYQSRYGASGASAAEVVMDAVRDPIGAPPLARALRSRGSGDVVVVTSDITRPVPYARFLGPLLEEIERAGVAREEILILVATGMHRVSTPVEHREMLGDVAGRYRIEDHDATDEGALVELPGTTWSGARVRLDRRYVEAGFRILTGLVEPHFVAGFSGGRKSLCPGLTALETIRNFHGYDFLAHPRARNACLEGNPLHEEALSVARLGGSDFTLNVVLDKDRRVVRAFAGDLEEAHLRACDFVRKSACPVVETPADVVVTSCGGHPLDTTFYQCVKGFVSCLPVVREGGAIVCFGGCSEGIGSAEYAGLMSAYSGRWRRFLDDIQEPGVFTRDQWELQIHARALEKVGQENLHFVTDGLSQDEVDSLSVTGRSVPHGEVQATVQKLLDGLVAGGASVALLPEGPYCAPLVGDE